MTWMMLDHDERSGIDVVGAEGGTNAYNGDTDCSLSLPILCIKYSGIVYTRFTWTPDHVYASLINGIGPWSGEAYYPWRSAHVATTRPVRGNLLCDRSTMNAFCSEAQGPGWRAIEHADGGWHLLALGNVRNDTRLWAAISDQNANCWN